MIMMSYICKSSKIPFKSVLYIHGIADLWYSHTSRETPRESGCLSQRDNPPDFYQYFFTCSLFSTHMHYYGKKRSRAILRSQKLLSYCFIIYLNVAVTEHSATVLYNLFYTQSWQCHAHSSRIWKVVCLLHAYSLLITVWVKKIVNGTKQMLSGRIVLYGKMCTWISCTCTTQAPPSPICHICSLCICVTYNGMWYQKNQRDIQSLPTKKRADIQHVYNEDRYVYM